MREVIGYGVLRGVLGGSSLYLAMPWSCQPGSMP